VGFAIMNIININDFFCHDDIRDYLTTPFNLNGMTIASTGYILVSFPKFGEFPDWDESNKVNMKNIVAPIYIDHNFIPIPDNLTIPKPSQCKVCEGSGKSWVIKCQECDGAGEVELENDFNTYHAECKSCEGEGDAIVKGGNEDCDNCSGSGMAYLKTDYVDVLGVTVNPEYMNLLINVTGIEIFPDIENRRLYFKCGEIRGLIMSMII